MVMRNVSKYLSNWSKQCDCAVNYYNNKRIKIKLKDLVLCNTELNPLVK